MDVNSPASICNVCSDTKDVKKHYGVYCCFGCKGFFRRSVNDGRKYLCKNKQGQCIIDKLSRNRCRACRLKKCFAVGMDENQLRDAKHYSTSPDALNSLPIPSTSALFSLNSPNFMTDSTSTNASMDLINFLTCVTKTSLESYDPQYAEIAVDEWPSIEQKCNRSISLIDGIKSPEKVCPRTKWDFSTTRPAEAFDLAFMWYRYFVAVADWANSIPQFRMLPDNDQALLMRLNFTTLSVIVFVHFLAKFEVNTQKVPLGTGSFVTEDNVNAMNKLNKIVMTAYVQHIVVPLRELDTDLSEMALLNAILLFQYNEGLSPAGRTIAKNYESQLYDALYEYQIIRFPDTCARERARRQTRILMIMAKMPQIWAAESDIHLIMSTFHQVNIDGIPKELLFYRFGVKHD